MSRRLRYDIPGTDFRVTADEVSEKGWPALMGAGDGQAPPLVVEIGFCRGEFLMDMATRRPDEAFEHDLAYRDAVPLLGDLRRTAGECGLEFGVKLTNTLQVENFRPVFDASENMMYLSGRPLHAITVNLAADLAEEFSGGLPMSFSAGADCFNAPHLLGAGMQTVTTCSDLLKTGGYMRLLQYHELQALFVPEVQANRRPIGSDSSDVQRFQGDQQSRDSGRVLAG